jgi:hypothetical protein
LLHTRSTLSSASGRVGAFGRVAGEQPGVAAAVDGGGAAQGVARGTWLGGQVVQRGVGAGEAAGTVVAEHAGDGVDLDVARVEVVGAEEVLAGEGGVLERSGGGVEEVDGGGAVEAKGAGVDRGGEGRRAVEGEDEGELGGERGDGGEIKDVEEVGALGEGEALEQEAVRGRGGVGPGVDRRVAAQADRVDDAGGEAGVLAVVDLEGEAVAVAAKPLHEGGGLGSDAVVEVEAEALELGEDAAAGVAGAQGEAELRAGGEAVVEAGVDELERVEVELEAGPEATGGAVDGAGEQRAVFGDALAGAQGGEVGGELDDRGGRDGAQELGEEEVAERVDEGRGGGVEASVHASGEEGVGLDQALEVGVVGGEVAGEVAGEVGGGGRRSCGRRRGSAGARACRGRGGPCVGVRRGRVRSLRGPAQVRSMRPEGVRWARRRSGVPASWAWISRVWSGPGTDLDGAQARLVADDRRPQAVLQGGRWRRGIGGGGRRGRGRRSRGRPGCRRGGC